MQKSSLFKSKKRGFTLIEILVVLAIISILAAIVVINVQAVRGKVKIARANVDVKNIEKALILFDEQYGDYPWGYFGDPTWVEFFSSDMGGEGEPYLEVSGQNIYLSEFYKSDWVGFNANYFVPNGYYYVYLWDNAIWDGQAWVSDGKIGCGYVALSDDNWSWYGIRYILCRDCNYCGVYDEPFQTTPIW